MRIKGAAFLTALALGSAPLLAGCGAGRGGPPPMGPPEVGVVTLEPQPIAVAVTLPGRTSPFAVSDVRPQINGIIQARLFTEGSNVRAGQPLYQIDPAVYRAAYEQAKGQLASAEANLVTAKAKSERYADLVKINGVAKQDADDARAAYLQALAAVQQNQAAVDSARINLDYTTVRSPISGRVGLSAFTKGALVTSAQTSALTTVQTLDPIYVDTTQSAAELLHLRAELAKGSLDSAGPASIPVSLNLEDGSHYPLEGKLQFTDITVDQNTGAVTLRAIFPNPRGVLLPGLYVRAVIEEAAKPNALLAPQAGVTRDPTGRATAVIVGSDGRAKAVDVAVEGAYGDKWIVTRGLSAGDRLIVEGLQKVRPGAMVRPVPAGSPPQPPPGPGSALARR